MIKRYINKFFDYIDDWCFGIAKKHPFISGARIALVLFTLTGILTTVTIKIIELITTLIVWMVVNGSIQYLLAALVVLAIFMIFAYPSIKDRF